MENNRDAFQAELLQFQRAYNERILAELERQTKKIEHVESILSGRLATDAEYKEKLLTLANRVDKYDERFERLEERSLSVEDAKNYKKYQSFAVIVFGVFILLQMIQTIPDLVRLFTSKP